MSKPNWFEKIFCCRILKQNEKLLEDVAYLEARMKKLLGSNADVIIIPDISTFTTEKVILKPYGDKMLSKYDLLCADLEYYALPKDSWLTICSLIQREVSSVLKEWKQSISDCDDWALLMNSFVAIAFVEAEMDKQGAFTVAWSPKHAYNTFTDDEGTTWVYEPQSNIVKGVLGETDAPYDTKMVWFPQSEA